MSIQVASNNVASAITFQGITDNALTHAKSRAVYIGVSQSLDFSYDGTSWVTFKGLVAGTVLPVQVVGVRLTAGSAAPAASDVVFIY